MPDIARRAIRLRPGATGAGGCLPVRTETRLGRSLTSAPMRRRRSSASARRRAGGRARTSAAPAWRRPAMPRTPEPGELGRIEGGGQRHGGLARGPPPRRARRAGARPTRCPPPTARRPCFIMPLRALAILRRSRPARRRAAQPAAAGVSGGGCSGTPARSMVALAGGPARAVRLASLELARRRRSTSVDFASASTAPSTADQGDDDLGASGGAGGQRDLQVGQRRAAAPPRRPERSNARPTARPSAAGRARAGSCCGARASGGPMRMASGGLSCRARRGWWRPP